MSLLVSVLIRSDQKRTETVEDPEPGQVHALTAFSNSKENTILVRMLARNERETPPKPYTYRYAARLSNIVQQYTGMSRPSIRRWSSTNADGVVLMLCSPTCSPRLWTLLFIVNNKSELEDSDSGANTHRSILNPLVLNPTSKPLPTCDPRLILPLLSPLVRSLHCLPDHLTLVLQRGQDSRVCRTSEEDEGPAVVGRLRFGWGHHAV